MAAHESEAAREIAGAWARTLRGIRDAQLQVGWLRGQFERLGAARAADVLTIVLARAEQREEPYTVVLLRASLALSAPALAGLKRAIAYAAAARRQLALARFLGAETDDGPVPERSAGGMPAGEPRVTSEPQLDPALARALAAERGRPLSLGERKSLARRRDRNLLARALRDPHPDVARILLDNPALTEVDVVRMCSRRPVHPDVLAQVFQHARWISRYRVRLTLALNPHTPEDIALQLLPHLAPADLKAVARSGDVSERVRAACSAPPRTSLH